MNNPCVTCFVNCAFYTVGIPTVLGSIDGTHVNVKTPSGPDGIQYINRKGQPSINIEVHFVNFNQIPITFLHHMFAKVLIL